MTASSYPAFQMRGGSTGGGGSNNVQVYGNTVDINGQTLSYGGALISMWDQTAGCDIFNNVFIGAATYLVATDADAGALSGTGNVIQNNVVTGNINDADWLEAGLTDNFSTNANNDDNAGTAFITTGNYPQYTLAQSYNGTGSIPSTDYNDNNRANPVDVGAFEFGVDPATGKASTDPSNGTAGVGGLSGARFIVGQ